MCCFFQNHNNWTSEYNDTSAPTEFDDWYSDPTQYEEYE